MSFKYAHNFVTLYYKGQEVKIDEKLAPIIQQCWELGIKTRHCCQGHTMKRGMERLGYIQFEEEKDAHKFMELLSNKVTEAHLFDTKEGRQWPVVRFNPL